MSEECLRTELGQWARQCGGYEMRCGQGDAGKLVRLERVRRWLMAGDDGLPAQEAGARIVAQLEAAPDLGEWLYLVSDGGYARLVCATDPFHGLYMLDTFEPEDCGALGACKWMGTYWVRRDGDYGIESVERLAVPVAKAQALWGWGGAASEAKATPAQPQDALTRLASMREARTIPGERAPLWTSEERRLLDDAVKDKGGRGVAGVVRGVAAVLKVSPRAVRDQLNEWDASAKSAESPVNSVFDLSRRRRNAGGR